MLVFGGSTALAKEKPTTTLVFPSEQRPRRNLANSQPFNLEKENEEWAENLKRITAAQFLTGGSRICLPFSAGERWLGCAILADRVNGLPYTVEELDLLKCIGDHIAADLSNLRLTEELMWRKNSRPFKPCRPSSSTTSRMPPRVLA